MSSTKKSSIYVRVEKNFYKHLEDGNDAMGYFKEIIDSRTWGSFRTVSKSLKLLAEILLTDGILSKEEYSSLLQDIKERQKIKNPKATIKVDEMVDFMILMLKDGNKRTFDIKAAMETNKELIALFLAIPILYHEDFKYFEKFSLSRLKKLSFLKTNLMLRWESERGIKGVLIKKHGKEYKELFEAYTKELDNDEPIFKDFLRASGEIKFYSQINSTYSDLLVNFLEDETNIKSLPLKVVTEIRKSLKDGQYNFYAGL